MSDSKSTPTSKPPTNALDPEVIQKGKKSIEPVRKNYDSILKSLLESTKKHIAMHLDKEFSNHKKAVDRKHELISATQTEVAKLLDRAGLLNGSGLDEENEPVTINVGGENITTTQKNWEKSPFLKTVITASKKDGSNCVPFVDLNPQVMRKIVEYLRTGDATVLTDYMCVLEPKLSCANCGVSMPSVMIGNVLRRSLHPNHRRTRRTRTLSGKILSSDGGRDFGPYINPQTVSQNDVWLPRFKAQYIDYLGLRMHMPRSQPLAKP
mmetsp:Transcript_36229/g.70409  ORF Transcript_36229/g.70409 Transcript_36229/m.70409 type:complete len:266 (+) Transcript_36229:63-860(+)